jgi:hypothetical protein
MLHETMEKKFMLGKVISHYTKKNRRMSLWNVFMEGGGGVLAQAKRMANKF